MVDDGEYHEEAVEAANHDFLCAKVANTGTDDEIQKPLHNEDNLAAWAQTQCARAAYVSPYEGRIANVNVV